jgi:hypothetical protein
MIVGESREYVFPTWTQMDRSLTNSSAASERAVAMEFTYRQGRISQAQMGKVSGALDHPHRSDPFAHFGG